jgi:hypothetical protein
MATTGRARWGGLLLAGALGCGVVASAPALPAGRVIAARALDGERAAVVVVDFAAEQAAVAVVDADGAPRWARSLARSEFARPLDEFSEGDVALAGETLVVHARDDFAFALADGAMTRIPGAGDDLAPDGWRVVAGRVVTHALAGPVVAVDLAGAPRWRIDAGRRARVLGLAAPGVLAIDDRAWRAGVGPEDGDDGAIQLVDADTGALRAAFPARHLCEVDGALLGVTADGELLEQPLAGGPPRVRVAWLGLDDAGGFTHLHGCHRAAGRLWLTLGRMDGRGVVLGLDPELWIPRGRFGVCDHGRGSGGVGRWLPLLLSWESLGVAAFDLEAGAPTWVQDREIHPPRYQRRFVADGLVVLHAPGAEVQHLLVFDPTRGEIAAAAAISGALPVDADDVRGGRVWLFSGASQAGGAHAPTVLDLRTLQVVAGAGPRVLDTTAEARASAGPAPRELGAVYDPVRDADPVCGRAFVDEG